MNSFFSFIIRMLIIIPIMVTTWLVNYVGYDQTFWLSTGVSIGGGLLINWLLIAIINHRFLKKHRLSRKEYQYIIKNLKEAKPKIYRLHKALLSIRHLPSLKQRMELLKITRKIYTMTKKEPKRFYKAERFYFSHLDSAVELTEKYVLLSTQPKKNFEVEETLIETRRTLEELYSTIEKDLYQFLSNDIDQLNFEIDVAKHSIKTIKESQIIDESRKLK